MRHQAIYELYPNVVQIKGNQQPTEQWDKDGNIVIIDENAVSTKESELQTAYDAKEYAREREAEYPDIYDYIDGVVKSDQAQIDKYIADCQAVKDKYSKGA